jgi:uncharacterized damage-inducible protein DinB
MSRIDQLIAEFEREATTTRRFLERLTDDKLEWQPHAKSFTAGGLASHITDLLQFVELISDTDEMDFDPATYKPYQATSVADLLKAFDENVVKGKQALAGVSDEGLDKLWHLKIMGRSFFEKPRAEVLRDFSLSHQIHHRGQLSVYLRLLDIPVPSAYGPTADEDLM